MNRFWVLGFVFAACMTGTAHGQEGTPGWIDITKAPYNAVGDGVTDNTKAFQDALHRAGEGSGGTVFVPRGQYLITGNLRFRPNVTLLGTWEFTPHSYTFFGDGKEPLPGSVLLATAGEGSAEGAPFISLHTNCAVKGLIIFYPNQTRTNPPKAYPWTIASTEGGADHCTVRDTLLVNPYQAIDFGTNPSGRHCIQNVYMHPLYRGIYIDKCYDIGRIENVHVWPFWGYTGDDDPIGQFVTANAEAFIFGRTDWEYVSNCFAIFYKVGFHFIKTAAGAPNVLITQSGADICPSAVLVEDCQSHAGVSFTNCQMFGRIVVPESNTGPVRFTASGFFGSSREKPFMEPTHADLRGKGHVSFDNCHFITLDPLNTGTVNLRASGGTFAVNNCLFMDTGRTQVLAEASCAGGIVLGNTFQGKTSIENRIGERLQQGFNLDQAPREEPGAIVIDDATSGDAFKTTGDWYIGKGGGDYAGVLHWAKKGAGEATASWQPDIPEAGAYAVYIWYGGDPYDNHATGAPFTVDYKKGTETVSRQFPVNLKEHSGDWQLLGEFPLEPGTSVTVSLTNAANDNVVADAVKFVKVK
jgi:hypothetical protein